MSTIDVATIEWTGASGRTYKHWIYKLPPNFKAEPGNYVFAREVSPGRWAPVYIGETADLSERFDAHHKAECIRRNGATHIHAHLNSKGKAARQAEEADLIARWKPSCNG